MALGSTEPLTEMSTRNLLGGKGLADNLTEMCEPRRLTTLRASTACYRDRFLFIDADAVFCSSVSKGTGCELDGRGSIHVRSRDFPLDYYFQTEHEACPASSICSPVMGFWAQSGRIGKLTANLHIVPRLGMHLLRCGAYAQIHLVTNTAVVSSKFCRNP
jgi:hypothetical protein